jgi:uncharacterized protein YndB with AHSA1/START domain
MTPVDSPSLSVSPRGEREVVMTRVFHAPRRLVFEAWTKPELLQRWFGARGWSVPVCEIDLRPGGSYRYVMRGPDGVEAIMRGTYLEIDPPDRLVLTECFEGFSEPGWRPEDETVNTIVLTELDGKTTWTLTTSYPSRELRDAAYALKQAWEGTSHSLDRLADLLRTRDLVVKRVFDAPVDQVWRAWTESEQVMRWWGPLGFTAPLAKMDVREGGTSLVCMRSPDGIDFYNAWTYTRIEPLEQIDYVLTFADKEGHPIDPAAIGLPPDLAREVPHRLVFKAANGQTTLTVTEYGYLSDETLEMSKLGLEQCLDKMAALLKAV